MNRENFSSLPDEIQSSARILPNGEICWPFGVASAAINAIANVGQVILGLDIRELDEAGKSLFEYTWSNSDTILKAVDAVEIGRSHAHASLNRPTGKWDRHLLSGSWVQISFVDPSEEDEESSFT